MLRMPAIVVGDHRNCGVADFCLPRELRFSEIRHSDNVEPELAVSVRFGERRELRAFHADIRAATMRLHADVLRGIREVRREVRAGWLIEADVRHDATAENVATRSRVRSKN